MSVIFFSFDQPKQTHKNFITSLSKRTHLEQIRIIHRHLRIDRNKKSTVLKRTMFTTELEIFSPTAAEEYLFKNYRKKQSSNEKKKY